MPPSRDPRGREGLVMLRPLVRDHRDEQPSVSTHHRGQCTMGTKADTTCIFLEEFSGIFIKLQEPTLSINGKKCQNP